MTKSLQNKFGGISSAQSVYFDGLYAQLPEFNKGFDTQTKERWLEDNLYNAFKTTDEYVWFYNERLNWWKGQVDIGVPEIINNVQNKINAEQNNQADQISGQSSTLDFKKTGPDSYRGFSYNYSQSKNILQIKLLNNNIKLFEVYENSRLIDCIENPAMEFTIDLNKKYSQNGNLILMSKDGNEETSVSYVN